MQTKFTPLQSQAEVAYTERVSNRPEPYLRLKNEQSIKKTGCRVGNDTEGNCPQVPLTGESAQFSLGKAPGVHQPMEQPAGLLSHFLPHFGHKSTSLIRAFHLEKHTVLSSSVENVKA